MILCLHLNPATKTKYIFTHDNSTEHLNSLNIQSREEDKELDRMKATEVPTRK